MVEVMVFRIVRGEVRAVQRVGGPELYGLVRVEVGDRGRNGIEVGRTRVSVGDNEGVLDQLRNGVLRDGIVASAGR